MNTLEQIITIAKKNGINQAKLAEMLSQQFGLKVTKQTVSDWKSSRSNSYYFMIPELSNILGVSCDYLLTGKEAPDTALTADERAILQAYHHMDEERKTQFRALSDTFAAASDTYKKDNPIPDMEDKIG